MLLKLKILLIIGLLLNVQFVNDIPEYTGNTIDLGTYNISTLYKGTQKQFVANKLNAENIYNEVSKEKGLWYLVLDFKVREDIIKKEDIWLQFRTNINAATLSINDKLLFTNGIVNNTIQAKIGGKNIVRKRIPKEYLKSGQNTIEIKFTNYKNSSNAIFRDISIGKLEKFQKHTAVMTTAPILFLGTFTFFVFINIILYFSLSRKKVFLLLALLFLMNSLLMAYEVLYWNGMVSSVSFVHSYTLRSGLEYITYFILLLMLCFEYECQKRTIFLVTLAFVLVYITTILVQINIAIALSFLPFGLSLIALIKRRQNAAIITIALFLLVLFNYLDDSNMLESYDVVNSNFIVTSLVYKLDSLGMIIFALVMIFISAKGILFKTKSLNEANLKLERLEYQFLQKMILPHFMVNSLMSLQQLVSKEPETAKKMIEALSEEFHLLADMSKKKLVPIHQEIEICKAHLELMSIQQKANYTMEVTGISGDEMIPPTIIHTLLENGITHGYTGNQNAYFLLGKEQTSNLVVYRLFNDSTIQTTTMKGSSGTGLKYVEARLEECYPRQWKLHSNKVENGWESIIEIEHKI